MKFGYFAGITLLLVSALFALDGDTGMHDPSTVMVDGGKFYSYGTGNGLPMLGVRRRVDVAAGRHA